jgi:hypothetical protein
VNKLIEADHDKKPMTATTLVGTNGRTVVGDMHLHRLEEPQLTRDPTSYCIGNKVENEGYQHKLVAPRDKKQAINTDMTKQSVPTLRLIYGHPVRL